MLLFMLRIFVYFFFFFFNDTATTEIYTLSLHDALPIFTARTITTRRSCTRYRSGVGRRAGSPRWARDRKSTRLNSSHSQISYAVFCLKKKKQNKFNQKTSKLSNATEYDENYHYCTSLLT